MANKQRLSGIFLALAALSLGACGKSHESLANDAADKMNQMVAVLKTVKDQPTAKTAGAQIQSLTKEMKDLKAEDDKLPKLSDQDAKALDDKMEAKMAPAIKDMQSEMMRIAALGPDVMKEIDGPMSDMKP